MAKEFDLSALGHLLVIVPHQDDEILMGAGLIYEMLRRQKKVTAAIVTNGDCGGEDYAKGRARLGETLAGLETLGLGRENVVFLGYADTGMPPEDSFLMKLYLEESGDRVHPSPVSAVTYGLEEKQDFHYQRFQRHGEYSRNTLIQDLRELFGRVRPDAVLTTHHSDRHGDHQGLFHFVREALDAMEEAARPRMFTGMVHSMEGDDTWPLRDTAAFTCPKGFEESGLRWEDRLVLPLPQEMRGGLRQGNLKYEALRKYEIALEPNAVDYLMAFIKEEEIFWEIG